MAAGMWQGLLAGYKNVKDEEERQRVRDEARAEKEEEILRRRRSAAAALRPRIEQQRAQVETFRSGLSYLEGRGLERGTLNALAQDPEAFQSAMDFASTEGADIEPARLNEIFRSTIVDGQTPADAQEYFSVLQSTLDAFDEVEDPEVFLQNLPAITPSRNTVVESRMPQRPMSPADQDTLWKNQTALFDQRVVEMANQTVESLSDRQLSGAGLLDKEQYTLNTVQEDLENFNTSDAAKARLRSLYGESVVTSFESLPQDFTTRFMENPYLQTRFNSQPAQTTPTPPDGGVLEGSGVDPTDGVMTFFYRMPDGTIQQVKE